MVWQYFAATAALSMIQGSQNASAQRKAGRAQAAWARYNADVSYENTMGNIATQVAIGTLNIDLGLEYADVEAKTITDIAKYNASIIAATSEYNGELLEADLLDLWDKFDLDLFKLELVRARERGMIAANQAASGTMMGEGSNMDVMISQKAMTKLDAFILRHGADVEASKIQNAIARDDWEAEVKIDQLMWEGEVRSSVLLGNAKTKAIADTTILALTSSSNKASARSAKIAGMTGAVQIENQASVKADNIMTNAMFTAGKSVISGYYANKTPNDGGGSLITEGGYEPDSP